MVPFVCRYVYKMVIDFVNIDGYKLNVAFIFLNLGIQKFK